MENKTVVLYHANCVDGFTAAWLSYKVFGDKADYIPVNYGEKPPEIKDSNIYILDFSYKTDVISEMARNNINIVVLDHHASAEKELMRSDWPEQDIKYKIQCWFDMNKSGARLTFEYFEVLAKKLDTISFNTMYEIMQYVEDRDLWRYKLPDSRAVNAYLQIQEKTFERWNELMNVFFSQVLRHNAIRQGQGILNYQDAAVKAMAKYAKIVEIEGHRVPLLNATGLISELGNYLCETYTFSMSYFVDSKGIFRFSLRSKGMFDVSEYAAKYGGGGHKNAAGFEMTVDQVKELGIIF